MWWPYAFIPVDLAVVLHHLPKHVCDMCMFMETYKKNEHDAKIKKISEEARKSNKNDMWIEKNMSMAMGKGKKLLGDELMLACQEEVPIHRDFSSLRIKNEGNLCYCADGNE